MNHHCTLRIETGHCESVASLYNMEAKIFKTKNDFNEQWEKTFLHEDRKTVIRKKTSERVVIFAVDRAEDLLFLRHPCQHHRITRGDMRRPFLR